jgi:hypothetical protein
MTGLINGYIVLFPVVLRRNHLLMGLKVRAPWIRFQKPLELVLDGLL